MLIELDNFETFPQEIIGFLDEYKFELLKEKNYGNYNKFSRGLENVIFKNLSNNSLKAYHYTKSISKGFFKKNGLKPLHLKNHINFVLNVLDKQTDLNQVKLDEIKETILQFHTKEMGTREDQLHFSFFRKAKYYEIKYLLNYFGGEAISMPLESKANYKKYLKSIGVPTVVIFKYVFTQSHFHKEHFTKVLRNNYLNENLESTISTDIIAIKTDIIVNPGKIIDEISYHKFSESYLK